MRHSTEAELSMHMESQMRLAVHVQGQQRRTCRIVWSGLRAIKHCSHNKLVQALCLSSWRSWVSHTPVGDRHPHGQLTDAATLYPVSYRRHRLGIMHINGTVFSRHRPYHHLARRNDCWVKSLWSTGDLVPILLLMQ
jgi:hypothetical protein